MHELRFLGEVSFGASLGGASRFLSRPRSVALLAVLAASDRGGITRDRIIALLWENVDQTRARHSLSNQLHVLRRALGPRALESQGEFVRLNPGEVWADVAAFRGAADSGDLERAAKAYGGPFLEGFHLDDAEEFERWLDGERRVLAARALDVLETLAGRELEADHAALAVKWLQRAVRLDPWNSRAAVSLARALAASGDPGNGVQHLLEHVRHLEEEMGLAPDPFILELIETADFGVPNGFRGSPGNQEAARLFAGVSPVSEPVKPVPGRESEARTSALPRRHRWIVHPVAAVAGALLLIVATGSLLKRVRGGEGTPSEALVVLPVRPIGVDSSSATLITSRLLAELADWSSYPVWPQEETEALWRRIGGPASAAPPATGIRRIARELGAGKVLSGRVSRSEDGIEVAASLISVPEGAILAEARSSGPVDSLGSIVRALVVRLAAREHGVPEDRIATLDRYDPAAVRLFIRAHPHGSDEQERLLRQAIAMDRTFALAALELYESYEASASGRDPIDPASTDIEETWQEIAAVVWYNRDLLSPADRAYAKARLGWRFADAHTAKLEVAAWEDAVRIAPDQLSHWQGLFRACYALCNSYTRSWQRSLLDVHDALLARGDSSRVESAMELALMTDDTIRLKRYAAMLPPDAWYGRWLAGLGLGDERERAEVVGRMAEMGEFPLMRIGNFAILTGLGLEDAELGAVQPSRDSPGSVYALRKAVLARERGRHSEYRRLRDKMFQLFDVSAGLDAMEARDIIMEWAAFGEPESEGTLDKMDRMLSRIAAGGFEGAPDSLAVAHCFRSWLRLERGDTTDVSGSLRFLETEPSVRSRALARICAPFLSLLMARGESPEAHAEAAARLHDAVRERPVTFGQGVGMVYADLYIATAANLELARSFGALGYPETGLQIAERRPVQTNFWGLYGFHVDFVREEARLLAQAGETNAALARYDKYFRLRPEPPDLASWAEEWRQVRTEYEALKRTAAS